MIMKNELDELATRVFSLIELIETIDNKSMVYKLLRKKILDIGNDILRYRESVF